jgi:amino acid permease
MESEKREVETTSVYTDQEEEREHDSNASSEGDERNEVSSLESQIPPQKLKRSLKARHLAVSKRNICINYT